MLAQLCGDKPVHFRRCLGVDRIGVQDVRDESVFPDDVGHHVPLAAVRDGVLEEGLNETAGEVEPGRRDDLLEEEVRLLNLVPVEQVRLAKLEVGQVIAVHEWDAEDVGGCEEPAATGGALVRDRLAFKGDSDVEDLGVGAEGGLVPQEGCEGGCCEGGDREAVLWVLKEDLLPVSYLRG